jgi:hypothetical protein
LFYVDGCGATEEGVRDQLLALFDKLARTPRRSVRADPVVDHLPLVDDDDDRFSSTSCASASPLIRPF